MKKYLLFALVALVSITAGAQSLGRRSTVGMQAKQHQAPAREMVRKLFPYVPTNKVVGEKRQALSRIAPANAMPQRQLTAHPVLGQPVNFGQRELRTMKPFRQASIAAPRRAAQVKEVYHATGVDYDNDGTTATETPVAWDMYPAQVVYEDESTDNVFVNVVPTPEEFLAVEGFEQGVYYYYTVDGNTVSIPAQVVTSYQGRDGNTYYIGLMALNPAATQVSEILLGDGSINLTLGEDGSLSPVGTTTYLLGVFSKPKVSGENYLGYYQWTDNVQYRYEGQKDPMPEGVTYTAKYDAYGVNKSTNTKEQWTLYLGEKTTSEAVQPVLVNIIPTSSALAAANPNGIAVPCTRSGNVITVNPVRMGQVVGKQGIYYLYLFDPNAKANNYAITLTLGDDGSLSAASGQAIILGAFTADTFSDPSSDSYLGWFEYYTDVEYFQPGEQPAPNAETELGGVFLMSEISPTLYGTEASYVNLPCDASITYKNYTPAGTADAYAWTMAKLDPTTGDASETLTGTDRDFTFNVGPNDWFQPATVTASANGKAGKPYTWLLSHAAADAKAYVSTSLYGASEGNQMPDGTTFVYTKASINANSITDDDRYGTPDINSSNLQIKKLVFYQGKPDAPLYFEGVNLLVWDLKNYDNIDLKCQIVKCHRDADGSLELGDVIAESLTSAADVLEGYVDATYGWNLWQLNWKNFYTTDEVGFEETLEYMQIEDEFCIVLDGWNNGTFSCSPVFESTSNVNGERQTYFNITGTEEYSEDDLLGYTSGNYVHAYVGFINPIYGYLHTDDDKHITLPVEGGSATLHIEPYLYGVDEETEEPTTGLWTEEDENPEYVFPEWIGLEVANEAYTETESFFDLVVSAEALPEGVDGRMETINLYQWGAKLTLTVVQGTPSGIVEVSGDTKKAANNHIYTLSGQRVNKAQKGVYIIGGKKQVVK